MAQSEHSSPARPARPPCVILRPPPPYGARAPPKAASTDAMPRPYRYKNTHAVHSHRIQTKDWQESLSQRGISRIAAKARVARQCVHHRHNRRGGQCRYYRPPYE